MLHDKKKTDQRGDFETQLKCGKRSNTVDRMWREN